MGPTGRTLSVSQSRVDGSLRKVTGDDLVESYMKMIKGFVHGGVDF